MGHSYVVLRDREYSTMVSTWDELRCVRFGAVKSYKLCLGNFEVLGGRAEFYDVEAGECVLPDDINDKAVQGFKDDVVIGYEVRNASYRLEDEFEFDNPSDCVAWIEENNWMDDELIIDLDVALSALGNARNRLDTPGMPASRF